MARVRLSQVGWRTGAACVVVGAMLLRRAHASTVSLGFWLARRGLSAKLGLVFAALAALVATWVAGARPSLWDRIPFVTCAVVAWSAGIAIAYGAASGAARRDAEEGVMALFRARGLGLLDYARGRVLGLSMLIALAVGGATVAAGAAAASVSPTPVAAARQLASGIVYALAFAATIGPVAFAALSGPSRTGGYLAFLGVIALPEIASPWTASRLPKGWYELTSIPAALDAIRQAAAMQGTLAAASRATLGLLALVIGSLAIVTARARRGDRQVVTR